MKRSQGPKPADKKEEPHFSTRLWKAADRRWMRQALALAKRALGQTAPNPLVGAVVLDAQGRKVSQGFHARAGEAHAEALALSQAGSRAKGGTLYCTLEPCGHTGRVGPCTDVVLKSGVKRVVVASTDVNPLMQGKSVALLRAKGLEVDVGLFADLEARLNAPFRHWIQTGEPLVTLKAAASADGYIGHRGHRVRLSGPVAEKTTMRLRAESQGLVIGASTLRIDAPRLTVRDPRYAHQSPKVFIFSETLNFPLTAPVFEDTTRVVVVTPEGAAVHAASKRLREAGVELWELPRRKQGDIELRHFLKRCAAAEMTALLVEGGAKLFESFLAQGCAHRRLVFQTPVRLLDAYPASELVGLPSNFMCDTQGGARVSEALRRGDDEEVWALPTT